MSSRDYRPVTALAENSKQVSRSLMLFHRGREGEVVHACQGPLRSATS